MKKILSTVALAVAALASVSAHAIPTVSFGGQAATDGSGLTSQRIGVANAGNVINPATGYYIETFDARTANPLLPGGTTALNPLAPDTSINIQQGEGCSINSFGTVGISAGASGFGVVKGSTLNEAATPAGNSTCYGVAPQINQPAPGFAIVDYTALLASLGANVRLSYLGLYYGSIDTYNDLYFYSSLAAATADVTNTGVGSLASVKGAQVLIDSGATPGDQNAPGSNQYVNIDFGDLDAFRVFKFVSTGKAVEVDNIVVGTTTRQDVPEPASLALLGVGLAALGLSRRRKNKAA